MPNFLYIYKTIGCADFRNHFAIYGRSAPLCCGAFGIVLLMNFFMDIRHLRSRLSGGDLPIPKQCFASHGVIKIRPLRGRLCLGCWAAFRTADARAMPTRLFLNPKLE